jgi:uncharacterized protein (DUF1330 family)
MRQPFGMIDKFRRSMTFGAECLASWVFGIGFQSDETITLDYRNGPTSSDAESAKGINASSRFVIDHGVSRRRQAELTPYGLSVEQTRLGGKPMQVRQASNHTCGGHFLALGKPVNIYELGTDQVVVLAEFDSLDRAIAFHNAPAYKAALRVLATATVERDISHEGSG